MVSRFELPLVEDLTPEPVIEVAAKKSRRPARKPKPAVTSLSAPAPAASVTAVSRAKPWATFGVGFTLVLSAALNGYANAQHAPDPWAGWLMGFAVPVLVLVLSKVSGEKYQVGQKTVAWFAGASGAALLFLSVWHCANSIALLTGSGLALAIPMAVAIDCGLVACEVAIISEPRP
jgi:FtsH-binding integral membrane protein